VTQKQAQRSGERKGARRSGRKSPGRRPTAAAVRLVTPMERDSERAQALLAERAPLVQPAVRGPGHDAFTLTTLNCNGLRSAERRGLLRWLLRERPDVLCLQEVRAWPDQVPPELRCPPGYNSRLVCSGKKGYAGVATYSRPAPDRQSAGSGLAWGDEEGRVLRSEFGDVVIVNVYAPSGSSSPDRQILKFEYMEHLARFGRALLAEGRPVALCGDLNIAHTELDIHDPKSNAKNSGFLPAERAWFSRFLEDGWVDVLRRLHPDEPGHYSWWSNRGAARAHDKGWRIDYVLANAALAARAEQAWIDKRAGLSDHAPVHVRFGAA
jgi:exodeoxyribonuclease-3